MSSVNSFSDWVESKFLDWERAEGERRSLSDFAIYLGVKRSTLSQWINDRRIPRDRETIDKLAYTLGNEVYKYLNIEESDPTWLYLKANWDNISPGVKAYIKKLADEDVGRESKDGKNNKGAART